ncbi:hypothetical protein IJT93_02000 [bacterium]|nr:hypothetical protein [bacterium]
MAVLAAVLAVFAFVGAATVHECAKLSRECEVNMVDIAGALEMFAYDDGSGSYPESLDDLLPYYFLDIPVCPGGGSYRYKLKAEDGEEYILECTVHGSH